MEKATLINYLNRPDAMKGEAVQEAQALVEAYPYFSAGQCLLAIAYQNEGDERYEGQLKKAAVSIANRNNLRLFSLLAALVLLTGSGLCSFAGGEEAADAANKLEEKLPV